MKKLAFLVIFPLVLYCQPSGQIGKDYFPKISFWDMYKIQIEINRTIHLGVDYSSKNYYYPQLISLGLTHSVTNADATSLGSSNPGIKVFDDNFATTAGMSFDKPYKYCLSTGNTTSYLPYEAGGPVALLNDPGKRYGLGVDGYTSWWIEGQPSVGDTRYRDLSVYKTVYHAVPGENSPGNILVAGIDGLQFPYREKGGHQALYRLVINAKLGGGPYTGKILHVNVYDGKPSGITSPSVSPTFTVPVHPQLNEDTYSASNTAAITPTTGTLLLSYDINDSDFPSSGYVDIFSKGTFQVLDRNSHSDIWIVINWPGNREVFIDKIAAYSASYNELFLGLDASFNYVPAIITNTENLIKTELTNKYSSIKTNPKFEHSYDDEPLPMMYRSVRKVSDLSQSVLGSGKYVCGATMGLPDDLQGLASLQSPFPSAHILPYVMYDFYPLSKFYEYSSSDPATNSKSLQAGLDNLVETSTIDVGYGVHRKSGLRQAIKWSQNFTYGSDKLSDDVPFIYVMSVCACVPLKSRAIDPTYYTNAGYYRAPTPNEILAQGFMALAYGAKGLEYFLVPNVIPYYGDGIAFYGLFDETGNPYNEIAGTGISQDPRKEQVPNERYYAVKTLNQEIDKISGTLLQLTWVNSYNIHLQTVLDKYIYSVTSSDMDGNPDDAANTFVELGMFKKTADFTNDNLEYFMLVNRRCLASEERNISVQFNKSSIYNNWKLTDVATGTTYTVTRNGTISIYLAPGMGKLFKMEPVLLSGGNLIVNEAIPNGSAVTIPNGTKISINPGVSLTVNGTLNASNVTFDRISGTSGRWGNIIFDGSGVTGSTLSNVNMSNGNEIRILNGAKVTVSNCLLRDFYHGIYIYKAAPQISGNQIINPLQNGIYGEASGLYPVITHNTITKTNHSGQGIHLMNSTTGYIAHNEISGCDYGVYIGSATAFFSDKALSMFYPNNKFTDNNTAMCAAWGGFISGGQLNYNTAYNTIHPSRSYDAYAYQSGNLVAQYNYWEGYNPKVYYDGTSSVSVSNMLADDPWTTPDGMSITASTGSSIEMKNSLSKTTATETDPVDLSAGVKLEKEGRLGDAISWYKTLVNSEKYQPFALSELMRIKNMYSNGDILNYLEGLSKVKKNSYLLKLLGDNYLQNGEFNKAMTWFDNAVSSSASEQENLDAKFSKLFAYINVKKDLVKAQEILSDIKKGNVSDFYFSSRIETAGNLMSDPSLYSINKSKKDENSGQSLENSGIVSEYALSQNYPNPFNPSTVINFEIPQASKVSLRVYDILGKEVATLVDGYKEMGRYSVQFNAKDLPSGMYIYEVCAGSFIKSAKMLFLK